MTKTIHNFRTLSAARKKLTTLLNSGHAVYTKRTPEGYRLFQSKNPIRRK